LFTDCYPKLAAITPPLRPIFGTLPPANSTLDGAYFISKNKQLMTSAITKTGKEKCPGL